MRQIRERKDFKRDFRRESTGRYRSLLARDGELRRVIIMLANDLPLESRYQDHPLHGKWEGSRECHIRPDLLLVYTYDGRDWLLLEGLGSHSHLFGL